MSFSAISMSLCSGRSAFVPASGIFGGGKLNLLPPMLVLLPPSGHISTHLNLCCRAVGLQPSPMPGQAGMLGVTRSCTYNQVNNLVLPPLLVNRA